MEDKNQINIEMSKKEDLNNNIHDKQQNNKEENNINNNANLDVIDGANNYNQSDRRKKADIKVLFDTTYNSHDIRVSSTEEKNFYELIRRWKVTIKDISMTLLKEDVINGFFIITIGGDFKVLLVNNPIKNKKKKIVEGSKGYTDQTEVIKNQQIDEKYIYEKEISIEIRDSIASLRKQTIVFELWDCNKWIFNEYKGHCKFNIYDILTGKNYLNSIIKQESTEYNNMYNDYVRLEVIIIFEELWDFNISFHNWNCTNVFSLFRINNDQDQEKSSKFDINFWLDSKKSCKVVSKVPKLYTNNPEWSSFNSNLYYRGTLSDLESEILKIKITNNEKALGNETNADLKDISYGGTISKFFLRNNDFNKLNSSNKIVSNHNNQNNKYDDTSRITINNKKHEVVNYKFEDSKVSGKINIHEIPYFRQKEKNVYIKNKQKYYCINFKDLKFTLPRFINNPKSIYFTCEWGGTILESSKLDISDQVKIFNFQANFLMSLNNVNERSSLNERKIALNNIFRIYSVLVAHLFVEDVYKCSTYIGTMHYPTRYLLESGKETEKTYIDESRESKKFKTKSHEHISRFSSRYINREITILHESWMYPGTLLKNVDFEINDNNNLNEFEDNNLLLFNNIKLDSHNYNINNENNLQFINKQSLEFAKFIKIRYNKFKDVLDEIHKNHANYNLRYYGYNSFKDGEYSFNNSILNKFDDEYISNTGNIFMFVKNQENKLVPLSAYLTKLSFYCLNINEDYCNLLEDIKSFSEKKTELNNFKLPVNNIESLLHIIRCFRFNESEFKDTLMLPNFVFKCKKGSKYELCMLLGCMVMSLISSNYALSIDNTIDEISIKSLKLKDNFRLKHITKNNKFNIMHNKKNNKNKLEGRSKSMFNDNEIENIEVNNEIINNENNNISNSLYIKKELKNYLDYLVSKKSTNIELFNNKVLKNNNLNNLGQLDCGCLMFICLGTLKFKNNVIDDTNYKHMWIMIISNDFRKIQFLEPLNKKTYELQDRINIPLMLRRLFTNSKYKLEWLTYKEDIIRNSKVDNITANSLKEDLTYIYNLLNTDFSKTNKKNNYIQSNYKSNFYIPKLLDEVDDNFENIDNNINDSDILLSIENNCNVYNQNNNNNNFMQKNSLNFNIITNNKHENFNDIIDCDKEYSIIDNTYNNYNNVDFNNIYKLNNNNNNNNIKSNINNITSKYFKIQDEKTTINDILPYSTIDVVFNNSFCFMNRQHPDPAKILYDLYDYNLWYPIYKYENFESCYNFDSFSSPYSKEELLNIKVLIVKNIQNLIKLKRSQKNLDTNIKNSRDIVNLLEVFSCILEAKDMGYRSSYYKTNNNLKHTLSLLNKQKKKSKLAYDTLNNNKFNSSDDGEDKNLHSNSHISRFFKWKNLIESKLNNNKFSCLPLKFNYYNEDTIQKFIEENCASFIQYPKKHIYYHISCKLFQYSNRLLSVRINICITYNLDLLSIKNTLTIKKTDVKDVYEEQINFLQTTPTSDSENKYLIERCNDIINNTNNNYKKITEKH